MRRAGQLPLQTDGCLLANLDAAERQLIDRCKKHAASHPSAEYRNFWMKEVAEFYAKRGMSRAEIARTAVYRVAQDIGSRRMVQLGEARVPDYRDDLEELIESRYPSRRAFCEAAGISEDMLSHVLARRKHLAISSLTDALSRIGFRLRIVEESEEAASH